MMLAPRITSVVVVQEEARMLAPRSTSVVVVQEGMKPGRWHTPTTAPISMIRVLLSFLFS